MVTIVDVDGFPEDLDEQLNDGKPKIVSVFGRAGSGKSVFNRRLYRSWVGDKLCIDVNGNAEPGADAERLNAGDLGRKWPAAPVEMGERPKHRNLHFRADPGSATYVEDLDRAVGMALFPEDRPCLLWAGEVGELMPNGRTGPSMRRLLMQNRHHRVTALFDGPRPMYVNPLVLAQSRFVAVYNLPNPADRKRVADSIGYPPRQFDEVHEECQRINAREKATEGGTPYWYLLWNAEAHQLYLMAPLPVDADTAAAHVGASA